MNAGALSVTELHFFSFTTLKNSLIDSSCSGLAIKYLCYFFVWLGFFPNSALRSVVGSC